jgi:biofilm protein TabA
MIIDSIESASLYIKTHAGFKAAFDFLEKTDLSSIIEGRYPIKDQDVFAIVSTSEGRGKTTDLEAHKKYIDIQFIAEGTETMGWKPVKECLSLLKPYDASKDIEFYSDTPQNYVETAQNQFCIFFPQDAHAPLSGTGTVKKIVIKVKA